MEGRNEVEAFYLNAQDEFLFFCKEVLGYKYNEDTGYKDLCGANEELCRFLQEKDERWKIILTPRYSFKSAITTCGYSLWRLVNNPNLRILIYSDTLSKAAGFLSDIKNHIEGRAAGSNFRTFYPNWESKPSKGKWTESEIVLNENVRTYSQREPTIDTAGIEQSKVGKHYDIIIFDDIVSDLNVSTKLQMDKTYECYRKALSLLIPHGEVILVGTRWHYGDCYGRLEAENKERNNFVLFVKDAEEVKDGKLIYEDIGLNRKFLEKQKQDQGSYLYSALYRQNPVSDETAIFKIDDFRYFDITPDIHKNMFVTCGVDPAGEGSDFTAMTVLGANNKMDLFVLDAINDHLKPNQIVDQIIKLNYRWGFQRLAIETNFFHGAIEKELEREIEEHKGNKFFTPFAVTAVTATLVNRTTNKVLSLQPYHERGQLFLPGKNFNSLNKNMSELAFQMIQFTIDGAKSPHDDLLVSLALNLEIIARGGEVTQQEPDPTSAAGIENEFFKRLSRRGGNIPIKYRRQFQRIFS